MAPFFICPIFTCMELDIYHIDSFAGKLFEGNPACVVPLDGWLPDELMLKIAAENAVAETAFFVKEGNVFRLRWFTPDIEMDLCGHATLAAAHVLKTEMGFDGGAVVFDTASGIIEVGVSDGIYILDFPSRKPLPAVLPPEICDSLSLRPREVLRARDYILVYDSEEQVRQIAVDRALFDRINLDPGGVAVTAPGKECDFVSRFFTPQATIPEDYVTGSAHCSLVPYWSGRFGRKELVARQISARPGTLWCSDRGDRVHIGGRAVTYMKGRIRI